jgi:phosphatidylglycerophosphatase A
MTLLKKILLTGLGTGYLRPAPGTWGSAACVGVAALALHEAHVLGRSPGQTCAMTMLLVLLVGTTGCIASGDFLRRTFGKKDPSHCTLDEWAGQAMAILVLPLGATWSDHLVGLGLAFVLFRVFDILKPPPVRRLEHLPGGLGVVADDLAAGIYANLLCQLILHWGVQLTWV